MSFPQLDSHLGSGRGRMDTGEYGCPIAGQIIVKTYPVPHYMADDLYVSCHSENYPLQDTTSMASSCNAPPRALEQCPWPQPAGFTDFPALTLIALRTCGPAAQTLWLCTFSETGPPLWQRGLDIAGLQFIHPCKHLQLLTLGSLETAGALFAKGVQCRDESRHITMTQAHSWGCSSVACVLAWHPCVSYVPSLATY